MRYINLASLSLPPDWEVKANAVLAELIVAAPGDRKKLIGDNASLWGELKSNLSSLSHGKCWYCELKQSRSDNAVDHFRPKNKVAECKGHEGYWWLAFDWHNYRFCCTFCNSRRKGEDTSGGKGYQFPLEDETVRALNYGDDCTVEKPMLLDPTDSTDPDLLWFYIDGKPTPRFAEDQDAVAYHRAATSIRLYHLDEERLEEQRRDLYQRLSRMVARANEALDEAVQAPNATVKTRAMKRFRDAAEEIKEALSEKAELSATARAFLLSFSRTGPDSQGKWVRDLLDKLK